MIAARRAVLILHAAFAGLLVAAILDAWETAALDQSLFDTLAIGWKDGQAAMDEIRFGATAGDVMPSAAGLAVPEPSTFALAALGLMGLAIAWRRRKRAA